jgi:hypothetical protein
LTFHTIVSAGHDGKFLKGEEYFPVKEIEVLGIAG